ncbi:MAG: hypothetical protein Kow0065_09000 [Methylomicrobium sp.]
MNRIVLGLLLSGAPIVSLAGATGQSSETLSGVGVQDVLQWGLALVVVLIVFGLFAWLLRRLAGITAGAGAKMRIVGGLSLGMRERVVVLEVGKKQLVLGVTPGRIETLTVLEGDDCLAKNHHDSGVANEFSQKLMQALKGRGHV